MTAPKGISGQLGELLDSVGATVRIDAAKVQPRVYTSAVLPCRHCGERGTTSRTHERDAIRKACSACGIRSFLSYELAWERITRAMVEVELDEFADEETP